MPSWKRPAFIAMVTLTPPSLFAFTFWGRNIPLHGLPLTLATSGVLCYAWVLANITVPYFTHPLRNLPAPETASFILADFFAFMSQPSGSGFLDVAKALPNKGVFLLRAHFHRGYDLVLTSPEALKEVLNDKNYDYEKPPIPTNFVRRIIGEGLVVAEGQVHKLQRKSVAPAFHGSHIKELIPLFWRMANHLTSRISLQLDPSSTPETKKREGVVEFQSLASRATLDIIGLAALGREFNTLENDEDEVAKIFADLTDAEKGDTIKYFLTIGMLGRTAASLLLRRIDREFNKATARLRFLGTKLVEEKKVTLAQGSGKNVDILSVLMRSSVPFTDEDLTNQLLTFLAAGSDTTANSLTWVCYLLSTYPDIQDRLRTELRSIVGDSTPGEADVNLHNIENSPFLSAVCNETLRLFPVVPATGRRAIRDTSILGLPVPKGTMVNISPWMINRLPSLWGADAEEFKPERWMNDGTSNTGGAASPYCFQTFLHGPRSCIGQGFAKTELKFLVSAMVLRFELEMADKSEVVVPGGAMTVKPKNGLRLRLRELY